MKNPQILCWEAFLTSHSSHLWIWSFFFEAGKFKKSPWILGPIWCFIVFPTKRWSCFRGRSWWHFPFWQKIPDSQILFLGPPSKKNGKIRRSTKSLTDLVGVLKAVLTPPMALLGFCGQPIPADVQHPRPYGSPLESCVAGHNMAFRIVRPMGPPPQVVEWGNGTNSHMYKPCPKRGWTPVFSRNVCR